MSNDPMDRFLDRWADAYDPPPETPREEIWKGVARAIAGKEDGVVDLASARGTPGGVAGKRPLSQDSTGGRTRWRIGADTRWWWVSGAAAAAVLAVGIGIGRWSASPGPGGATPGADVPGRVAVDGGSRSFQQAARAHFGRTESFLTLVRADARAGRVEPGVAGWAQGLLSQTRLLMDSPAGEDGATRRLLEDLELILIQVAGVDPGLDAASDRRRTEMDLIASGIEEQAVLSRLQALLPRGPEARGS